MKLSREQQKELNRLRSRFPDTSQDTLKEAIFGRRCKECLGRVDIKTQRSGLDVCRCRKKVIKSLMLEG